MTAKKKTIAKKTSSKAKRAYSGPAKKSVIARKASKSAGVLTRTSERAPLLGVSLETFVQSNFAKCSTSDVDSKLTLKNQTLVDRIRQLAKQAALFADDDQAQPTRDAISKATRFFNSFSCKNEPRIGIAPGGEIMAIWSDDKYILFCADGTSKAFIHNEQHGSKVVPKRTYETPGPYFSKVPGL